MKDIGSMHERLKRARLAAGFSTATAAINKFGWKGSTYRAHENRQNQYDSETAKMYGRAYGVNPGWLLTGVGDMTPPRGWSDISTENVKSNDDSRLSMIFVCGRVAAGVWMEDFLNKSSNGGSHPAPFPPDPRFPVEAQFDLLVEGSSINKFAQEGDYIRCVDVAKAGIEIQDGDLVVIERIRERTLRETSARRVRRNGDRYEFWPESDDPRWQTPILVKDGASDLGDDVRTIAKVLWKYRAA